MIDPANITNHQPSEQDLQEQIIFWVCVAGKSGHVIARILNKHLFSWTCQPLSFCISQSQKRLAAWLADIGIGCYNLKAECLKEIAYDVRDGELNLHECSLQQLLEYPGIGNKTARGFLMHTRPNMQLACLDRHVLSWLRDNGRADAPKNTPQTHRGYQRWETIFLKKCKELNLKPEQLDLQIWNERNVHHDTGTDVSRTPRARVCDSVQPVA